MRKLSVLPAVTALLALSMCRAAAEPLRIVVDASKSLGPISEVYRDFGEGGESSDPDFLRPLIAKMKALRPRIIRIDHVFDYYVKCRLENGHLEADFANLDRYLDSIVEMGAQPQLSLSYTPVPLQKTDSILDPPNDRRLWMELVYKTVRHINVERKLGIKYWEMWNEPNLEWFWRGTLQDYLSFYTVTAKAALRADPRIKFGGPAASFNAEWLKALMDHAKSRNLPLDFVSWHDYYNTNPSGFRDNAAAARAWLAERGMKAELFINEWNLDAGLNPGNDDSRGAAHVAFTICNVQGSELDYAPFFEIKDGADKNKQRYWGRWGLFTADNHPKANYYAFVAFSRLGGDRLAFEGGTPQVGGMAAGTGRKLGIILYNTGSEDVTADLNLSGLQAPAVKLRRFLIDETHSNPVKQGHDSRLEQVENRTLPVQGGSLQMQVTLPKISVTLIELEQAGKRG